MPASRPTPAALLIIDMMNLFDFEGGAALGASALGCLPAIRRLCDRFDEAGAPVIYVNDNFAHWQGEFRDLMAECVGSGGASSKIVRAIAPRDGHYYVLKPKHSAFLGTPLGILLAKLGVRQLVLTGIAADSCVMATALDANMREYALWVPSDAVASTTPAKKTDALALLKTSLKADTRSTRSIPRLFPAED